MRFLFFPIAMICICLSGIAQKPNIIYIMTDDHSAKAISAYDKTLTVTPNIDGIAKEGIRFSNFFIGNSICG
ncbi:MAG: sulfatase-like hydrolase/transferase, partial [Chitinophagaceae bacterium]